MMQNIIQSFEECKVICYPAYRTAKKLRILQKELKLNYVQLDLIAGVFERHRLSSTENTISLDPSEIEDVLSDIFFATSKETNLNFDVDQVTKLGLDYITSIFDKSAVGRNILVFSVKVALIVLSSNKMQDKFKYLFDQLADHNACLSKAGLNTLLNNLCKITEVLGEIEWYGYDRIQSHIDNCFIKSQGCLGVTESEFVQWMAQDPSLLAWTTAFNRMQLAENVIHNKRCSTCNITPIQGLRYTCVKCTAYHQCENCFLTGQITNKHKLKHPVREYYVKSSNREMKKLLIELIRNKFRICPLRPKEIPTTNSFNITTGQSKSFDTLSLKRKILTDPQQEMQSIINGLEEENKQLQLQSIDNVQEEILHRHKIIIESQLQRLRLLKKCLFNEVSPKKPQIANHQQQSTPMPQSSRTTPKPLEFELSPILHQTIVEREPISTFSTINLTKEIENSENLSTVELSTWIGGQGQQKSQLNTSSSGFSRWFKSTTTDQNNENDKTSNAIQRENTPSSLQRPDKHSQHSSLQNIQGDLNDILDRLQNMVANDCLLEESYTANDNSKLKLATTEMEDLLTGLIEGMESRKSKLTTIV